MIFMKFVSKTLIKKIKIPGGPPKELRGPQVEKHWSMVSSLQRLK